MEFFIVHVRCALVDMQVECTEIVQVRLVDTPLGFAEQSIV